MPRRQSPKPGTPLQKSPLLPKSAQSLTSETQELPNLNNSLPGMEPHQEENHQPPSSPQTSRPPSPAISGSKKSGGNKDKYQKLSVMLQQNVASIGMMLAVIPVTSADGLVVLGHTESLTERLIDCARTNDKVYEGLLWACTASVWAALGAEVVAIAAAIAVNHGLKLAIPGLGTPDKVDFSSTPDGNIQMVGYYANLDPSGFPQPASNHV